MFEKEHALPGAIIMVDDNIKHGAGVIEGGEKPSLSLFTDDKLLGWDATEVVAGSVLQVVKKPRRVHGRFNCCRVRVLPDGPEGEVYWTELRSSTTLQKK